jgi:hypothetical protein
MTLTKSQKRRRAKLLQLVPEIGLVALHKPDEVIVCDDPFGVLCHPNPVADLALFAETFRAVWYQLPPEVCTKIVENWPGGGPGKPGCPMVVIQPGKSMPERMLSSGQAGWSYWFSAAMLVKDHPSLSDDQRKLVDFHQRALPFEIALQMAFAYRAATGVDADLLVTHLKGAKARTGLDKAFRAYFTENTAAAFALTESWGFTHPRMPR